MHGHKQLVIIENSDIYKGKDGSRLNLNILFSGQGLWICGYEKWILKENQLTSILF
jgi:hypothetical protein